MAGGHGDSRPSPKIRKVEQAGPSSRPPQIDEDEDSQEFDEETQSALEEIDTIQNKIDTLNEAASEEILKVEQRYNKLRKPFYDIRGEVISKIPNFWVRTMTNHPQLSLLINEDEEDCLHSLTKLDVEEFEDVKGGYRIKFHFEDNPFFENDVLTKEFYLEPGQERTECTEIRWKDKMDLTEKQIEGGKLKRKRGEDFRTFFTWFNNKEDPAGDDVAEVIKDDLWSNPLQYYLSPDVDIEAEGEEEESDLDDGDVSIEEEEDEDADDEELLNNGDTEGDKTKPPAPEASGNSNGAA